VTLSLAGSMDAGGVEKKKGGRKGMRKKKDKHCGKISIKIS